MQEDALGVIFKMECGMMAKSNFSYLEIPTSKLFLDESFDDPGTYKNKSNKVKFGLLVGILIKENLINKFENKFFEDISLLLNKNFNNDTSRENLYVQLHGSSLLKEYNDEIKYKVIDIIVELIIYFDIKIIAFYCNVNEKNFPELPIDPKINNGKNKISKLNTIMSFCWIGFLEICDNIFLKENIIIPIIESDKHNKQQSRNFSGPIQSAHSFLKSSNHQLCSLQNHNNMKDPEYIKKGKSLFLCIADIIAYLFSINKKYDDTKEITLYKHNLLRKLQKIPENHIFKYNLMPEHNKIKTEIK